MARRRILVEYSSKNRPNILARSVATMLDQTYQDWDLLIINDGPAGDMESDFLQNWLKRAALHRQVWVIEGTKIDQAHNHNIPLWTAPWRDYELILRIDDDVLPGRLCLELLLEALDSDPKVVAAGGLWFENEALQGLFDRMIPSLEQWLINDKLRGEVAPGITSNWPQRVYHFNWPGEVFTTEHLYSTCLYRAEAMRRAGGWPQVYTPGVAHGEETDGTYRLHLAGHKMVVVGGASGQHLKASGGIRSARDVSHAQFLDRQKWQIRMPLLRERSFATPIKVGVWCQHPCGIGGAQRLYYHTLQLLQSIDGLDVYPLFHGARMAPQEVEETFGLTYEERDPLPDALDVVLQFGHGLVPVGKELDTKARIACIFYPDEGLKEGRDQPEEFCTILGISDFVVQQIGRKWGYAASRVYPPVTPIPPLEKEKTILVATRMDTWKAPLWLMERFVQMGLVDWEMKVIGSTTMGKYADYEEQCRQFAAQHENITLYEDIPQEQLAELFGHASILWAARGLYGHKEEREVEHFGYTPIEAMTAGVVPIVYDAGGYRETVPDIWRWTTAGELKEITHGLIGDEVPTEVLDEFDLTPYSEEEYLWSILRVIQQANGMAVELQQAEARVAGVRVLPKILGISDSPRLRPDGTYTGFGVSTEQIYRGFLGEGWRVNVLARYDYVPSMDQRFDSWWPCYPGDDEGMNILPLVLSEVQPDVIFAQYDPGSLTRLLARRDMCGYGIVPMVAYFPIEGTPIVPGHVEMAKRLAAGVCYTKYGMEALIGLDPTLKGRLDYAHLGLDHADFRPLPPEDRAQIRRLVGWEDKFVIGAVATNKRTKMWPYLLEVIKLLQLEGHEDILLYCHTTAEPIVGLQGHPLEHIMTRLGVESQVRWPLRGGAPYDDGRFSMDDLHRLTPPPIPEQKQELFSALSMVQRYSALDLYLDLSSVEGFGLPMGEAMACGVPCLATHDYGAKSEVYDGGVLWMEPRHHDWWHTGVRLWLADPRAAATIIAGLKGDHTALAELSERGYQHVQQYKWEPVRAKFVEKIRSV